MRAARPDPGGGSRRRNRICRHAPRPARPASPAGPRSSMRCGGPRARPVRGRRRGKLVTGEHGDRLGSPGNPRAKASTLSKAGAAPHSGRSAGARSPRALMTASVFMLLVRLSTERREVQGTGPPALPSPAAPVYPRAMAGTPPERIFTVSEITERIKGILEDGFPRVVVEGEVSNFRPSSTGHLLLQPEGLRVRPLRGDVQGPVAALSFQPADGMLVRASGGISVYARRGSYQIICESLAAPERETSSPCSRSESAGWPPRACSTGRSKSELPLFPSRVADRHLAHGRGAARHPARPGPAQRGDRRRDPSRPRAGRGCR